MSYYLTKSVFLKPNNHLSPNNYLDSPTSVINYFIEIALWIMVKLYNKFINLESLSKEIIQFQFQNIQQNLDLKGEYNDPIGQECY